MIMLIKRIKSWFYDRFLPMWAKETILVDCRQLRKKNEQLLQELAKKDAYIDGLQAGMKAQRRIIINNTGEVKK